MDSTVAKFVIHHISDVHVGSLAYAPEDKLDLNGRRPMARNLNEYISWLNSRQLDDVPDLVIISGDLTSFAQPNEWDIAAAGVERLVSTLKRRGTEWRATAETSHPYVLIVPGNHDLDWSKASWAEKVAPYAQLTDRVFQQGAVLSAVYPPGVDRPSCHDFGNSCNLSIALVNTTTLGGTQDPALRDLCESLESEHRKLAGESAGGLDRDIRRNIERLMRRDPGYVDPLHLDEVCRWFERQPPSRIRLAVMHHNLSSVPSEDVEAFDTIVNAGFVKSRLWRANVDVVLQGHRHIAHAVRETCPIPQTGESNLSILTADSLGCKERAPFLEITLHQPGEAHDGAMPTARLSVTEFSATPPRTFAPNRDVLTEFVLDRPFVQAAQVILSSLGIDPVESPRSELVSALRRLLPPTQSLEARVQDWSDRADEWIRKLHEYLPESVRLIALDVDERSAIQNARFRRYLQEQYLERLRRLRGGPSQTLRYSDSVLEAIRRTGWTPEPAMWEGWNIESRNADDRALEIVRILIRPPASTRDRDALATLDFEHRMVAIPLFVLPQDAVDPERRVDCAVAIDQAGHVLRAFEFVPSQGTVREAPRNRGAELSDIFDHLLGNERLYRISQFLGESDRMIQGHDAQRAFANTYLRSRAASPEILRLLREHIKPSSSQDGLDVGCGTGNYTLPFGTEFRSVTGLDENLAMLDAAQTRPGHLAVRWVVEDVLRYDPGPEAFDAIWSISTLHYLSQREQEALFTRLFRWLRPGGRIAVDTEFAEQLPSLWVMEYFPSLRVRFEDHCLSVEIYRAALERAGFREIAFPVYDLPDDKQERVLRSGQRDPRFYLDPVFRGAIPAFQVMTDHERQAGTDRLRRDIASGQVNDVIKDYRAKATMSGDFGFIVGTKPGGA